MVQDSFYTEMGDMEHTYLLQSRDRRPPESLHRRAAKLLLIMSGLLLLSVLMTFAFTPLFVFLDEDDSGAASYLNAFAEGLLGGAFLATISSTMIPRIQQDSYRSHWSKFTFHSIGMFAFVGGLLFSVLLDVSNLGFSLAAQAGNVTAAIEL